jgi:Transglycosylase-like domain
VKVRFRSVRILVGAVAMVATCQLMIASAGAEKSSGGLSPFTTSGGSSTSAGDGQTPTSVSRYERLWDRIPFAERRWAHQTAECESGRDPNAIGGGGMYRGAFQFLRSSWKHAPRSPGGDPIDYSYRTQAVVAVALKRQLGTKPWPVCG